MGYLLKRYSRAELRGGVQLTPLIEASRALGFEKLKLIQPLVFGLQERSIIFH